MKFMTYNILDGGQDRLGLIAKIISSLEPDFVAINEANGFEENDSQKLKEMSRSTGLIHYHIVLSGQQDYHVAILSKAPFKAIEEIHPLTRGGIHTVVDTEVGEVSVISAHLSPYSEIQRLPELERLLAAQQDHKNKILMGDMNSLSVADNYKSSIVDGFNDLQLKKFTKNRKLCFDVTTRITEAGYADTAIHFNKQGYSTTPTASNKDITHTKARLDYIFISESLKNRLVDYAVVKNDLTERASDHYPVLAEIM